MPMQLELNAASSAEPPETSSALGILRRAWRGFAIESVGLCRIWMDMQPADKSYETILQIEKGSKQGNRFTECKWKSSDLLTRVRRLKCDFSQILQPETPSPSNILVKPQGRQTPTPCYSCSGWTAAQLWSILVELCLHTGKGSVIHVCSVPGFALDPAQKVTIFPHLSTVWKAAQGL